MDPIYVHGHTIFSFSLLCTFPPLLPASKIHLNLDEAACFYLASFLHDVPCNSVFKVISTSSMESEMKVGIIIMRTPSVTVTVTASFVFISEV